VSSLAIFEDTIRGLAGARGFELVLYAFNEKHELVVVLQERLDITNYLNRVINEVKEKKGRYSS
jgi:hypothetical protein